MQSFPFPGDHPKITGRRLSDGAELSDALSTWHVARTATRREPAAEEGLIEAGYSVYLPRLTRWKRQGAKKVRHEQALFAGYLFVGLSDTQSLYGVRSVEGVHNIVRFSAERNPRPVAFPMIRDILREEQLGAFDKTRRDKFKDPEKGSPVHIVGGQFQGFPAQFVERRSDERIAVLFQMFGRWSPLNLKAEEVGGFSVEEDDR